MKRLFFTIIVTLAALCAQAAAPNSSGTYYSAANGKKGEALKTAMCGIIYNRTERTYKQLWTDFKTTDVRSDGKIWDMYSNNTSYVPGGSAQGANYSAEGDSYNREHSFPQSWFGSNTPMYTDLHHIYPTDGFVNSKRSNYPFGETNGTGQGSYQSNGGFSKLGACTVSGYTGKVFEPADEYKGDFARTYFYMVTCYEEKLHDWVTNYSSTEVTAVLDGNTYPGFTTWTLNMLLAWAAADPVSEKETARNNAVYGIQGNRNPFIDYPGLEQYIWGSKTDVAFSYDNYEGSGSGSGTGGGTTTGGTTITISYADIPDGFTATTGTSGTISKTVSSTNDLTVAYSGINTKSSATAADHAYGYAMFLNNKGYIYNSSAPAGYYPSKVTATFSSSTGTSGKVGINYGTSALSTRNSSVTGAVTQSGTYEATNTDETKLYWNFSTTGANVQVTKIEIVYSPVPQDPVTYSTPTATSYNNPFTLVNGTHFTTDGTVTLHSDNEAVATVDGLTVTPKAVGECFISVTYGQSTSYKASNSVFKFTVNAPDGKTTAAPSGSATTVFKETFAKCSGTGGNDGSWSGSIASATIADVTNTVNNGWTFTKGYVGKDCTRLSSSSDKGSATTPALGTAGTLTITFKAGAWSGDKTTGGLILSIEAGGGTLGQTTFNLKDSQWSSYETTITGATAATKIKFSAAQKNNNRFFLDEVEVTKPGEAATQSVKLNSYGYATYCSEYPLDFSNATDYSAWQVTGVSGETITFKQVTGAVKGGTGLLLMGTAGKTVTLNSVASSNVLDGNLLHGTLAPTYVETDTYYGLKDNEFVKVNAGTVPAGKALLPIPGGESEVKSFTFVFEGGLTPVPSPESEGSAKREGSAGAVYDLSGRRIANNSSTLPKGIYIRNGKKILVK